MSQECIELVVYTVYQDKIEEFKKIREQIYQEISQSEGFVSAKTLQSIKSSHQFVDYLVWENQEVALKAFENFRTLAHAKTFLSTIQTIRFSDHLNVLITESRLC